MFDPGQSDLPDFFRRHEVEVVSSLPYFLEQQTDAQRGHGVFHKSIEALLRLNAVGYGVDGSSFVLNLVYNPVGAFLPPPQASIEADFKRELLARYGVSSITSTQSRTCQSSVSLTICGAAENEERYIGEGYESENSNKSADSGFS